MKSKTKIAALLGLLLLFCSAASAFDVNDPIAHWKLDEGIGTTAYDSAGSNDGTLIGDPCWIFGKIGNYALDFDGDGDYVNVASSSFKLTTHTTSFWMKPYSLGAMKMVEAVKGTTRAFGFIGLTAEGRVSHIVRSGILSDTNKIVAFTDGIINAGTWYHVVSIMGLEGNKIYINGIEQPLSYWNGSPSSTESWAIIDYGSGPDNLNIGSYIYDGVGHEFFDGKIDDVRIYNRALSADEVQYLYQQEPNQPEPNEPQLTLLEITGSDEVAENSQTQYKAIAHYDNSSTKDVTDSAQWSVEPETAASIDANGLLTTETIFKPQDVTVFAQYSEGDNTAGAEKDVSILAICPGPEGSALSFDGSGDYVSLGNAVTHNLPKGSFTAWVYPADLNSVCGRYNFAYVIGANNYSGGELGFRVYGNGGGWASVRNTVSGGALYFPAGSISVGNWHHVAMTWNGSLWKLYIDFVEKDSKAFSQGTSNASNAALIGKAWDGCSWNGIIDDVRIYSRALSAGEIQTNMHTPLSGSEPNLVAYWNFNEGLGQIARDTSPGGHNGFLGSDPCNPDDSDPAWVDSNAPIGSACTIQELIERNISGAIEIKLNVLDEIEQALEREKASAEMLEKLSRGRKPCWWRPNEILRKLMNIRLAILYEQMSIKSVEKSIDKLEDKQCPPGPRR